MPERYLDIVRVCELLSYAMGTALGLFMASPLLIGLFIIFLIARVISKDNKSLYHLLTIKYPVLYELHSKFFNYPLWEQSFACLPRLNGRVLHLACGTGLGTRVLDVSGDSIIELDINVCWLHYGKKKGRLRNPIAANAMELPFLSKCFDTILIPVALHHIRDLQSLFRECRRVMKEESKLVIFEPVSIRCKPFMSRNTFHDGIIWIFDKTTLIQEIGKLASQSGLIINSIKYYRSFSLQNYNGIYNMCDAVVELVPKHVCLSMK